MHSVDRIHPAGAFAVGELAERVSAKAGGRVDRADVVVLLTDRAQVCVVHGLHVEIINRCVLLQRIRCGGDPCDVFGQIAVIRQVNILRSLQCTDETECDFHITGLHSIEIGKRVFKKKRHLLTGSCISDILARLLKDLFQLLLRRFAVFLQIETVIFPCQLLERFVLLLFQNFLIARLRIFQSRKVCDP